MRLRASVTTAAGTRARPHHLLLVGGRWTEVAKRTVTEARARELFTVEAAANTKKSCVVAGGEGGKPLASSMPVQSRRRSSLCFCEHKQVRREPDFFSGRCLRRRARLLPLSDLQHSTAYAKHCTLGCMTRTGEAVAVIGPATACPRAQSLASAAHKSSMRSRTSQRAPNGSGSQAGLVGARIVGNSGGRRPEGRAADFRAGNSRRLDARALRCATTDECVCE